MNKAKTLLKRTLTALLWFFFVRWAQKRPNLPSAGTALVIAPHPDDETLGCGALIARLREMGLRVNIIVVTDGGAATPPPGHTHDSLVLLRRREALQAAQALGLTEPDLTFLSYSDGKASNFQASLTKDLASHIWLSSPALILSPYLYDHHPDHCAVAQAVESLRAAGKITCPIFEYPVWFWPQSALNHLAARRHEYETIALCTQEYIDVKRTAVDCYASQTGGGNHAESEGFLDPLFVKTFLGRHEIFFQRK